MNNPPHHPERRSVFRRAAISAAMSVVLLVTMELALRVLFHDRLTPRLPEPVYEFDKDCLVALRQSITNTYARSKENGGQRVVWWTNKDGFRGKPLRSSPGFRIMVYGDSNILARFCDLWDTFPCRLEHYLVAVATQAVEVVNAGVEGFGPDQSLIRFRREIDTFRPSLVIFHVFADNDFGDIVRNRLFDVNPEGKLVPTGFEPATDPHLEDALGIRRGIRGFLSSLMIVRGAKKTGRRLSRREPSELSAERWLRTFVRQAKREYDNYRCGGPLQVSHFVDQYDIDLATDPAAESSRTKLRLMEGVLAEAKAVADAAGVRLLVLIQPSQIDLTHNFVLSYEDLARLPGYARTNLTGAVEDICTRHGIDRVNLYGPFSANDPSSLFLRGDDNHWNEAGQDLAAGLAAEFIVRRGWLREGKAEGAVEKAE